MQLSNIPGKLVLPFANAGGKSTIPVASQIGITAGAASLTDGFPPLTRTPIAAGGVPPSGLDMNGILYEMSAIIRWANAGGGYPYDSAFATDTNVGGYPKGARVMRSDGTGYWFNTAENNVTDPESAGAVAAGWVPDYQSGVASVAMSSSTVTLSPAQYGKSVIVITGTLTANLNLIFPNIAKDWFVINSTTGAFSITAKTDAGVGVLLGTVTPVYGDGVNIYSPLSDIYNKTDMLKGVSLVGGAGRVVDSILALKALPKAGSSRVFVTGYYATGDGGGGEYWYDPSDITSTDDGGSIIVATDGGRWKLNISGPLAVEQFGAKGGANNDSAAFNATLLALAKLGNGRAYCRHPSYTLQNTVIIPSYVELDLCGAGIVGPGIGSLTDLFQTGYLSGGALVTNIGTANESHLIMSATVKNGSISNCGKAFNLFNFIDNCEVSNLRFQDCTYAVLATRSWYSRFVRLFSRGAAGGATNGAFVFTDFVNVIAIESLFVEGRTAIGIGVYGGANGQKLLTCSAENCATGLAIANETGPIEIDTCYFENISGVAVDCNSGSGFKYSISFRNNWFASVPVGIRTEKTSGARIYVDETNRFNLVTTPIDADDPYNNYGEISIITTAIADNGLPAIPAGYVVNGKSRVNHENIIFDSFSGLARVITKVHGDTLIAFEHEGGAGTPKSGTVAFCTATSSGGTSFSIYVDTKIKFNQWSSFLAYRFSISDNSGSYELFGQIFGDQVKIQDAVGKTAVVSNNGGFVRLALATFTHPSGTFSITGVIRHM